METDTRCVFVLSHSRQLIIYPDPLSHRNTLAIYFLTQLIQTEGVSSQKVTLKNIQTALRDILNGQYHFALLLGSSGTDRFHQESDIDLAVFFKNEPTMSALVKLKSRFYDYFDRECDLIQLNKIDPIFARQVLETGREIDVPNRETYNIWKSQQLSTYPDFKESRKIIEENLLNRKRYV